MLKQIMGSLHMCFLSEPEPKQAHMKGLARGKKLTTYNTFLYVFSCHSWFEMLTKETKTNGAPFYEPSMKQYMNLQWTKG